MMCLPHALAFLLAAASLSFGLVRAQPELSCSGLPCRTRGTFCTLSFRIIATKHIKQRASQTIQARSATPLWFSESQAASRVPLPYRLQVDEHLGSLSQTSLFQQQTGESKRHPFSRVQGADSRF